MRMLGSSLGQRREKIGSERGEDESDTLSLDIEAKSCDHVGNTKSHCYGKREERIGFDQTHPQIEVVGLEDQFRRTFSR